MLIDPDPDPELDPDPEPDPDPELEPEPAGLAFDDDLAEEPLPARTAPPPAAGPGRATSRPRSPGC